jgi:catechol 2,3-dioxygenase-like lactoylglutathione lyase family enzyme
MEQRISLITLGVADLARSRSFYEHGLGWHPSRAGNAQVAFFQTGGMVFALSGKTALAQDAHLSHEGTGFGGIALAYHVRQRAEVETV